MAWQERLVGIALALESLQLTRHIDFPVIVTAYVQRYHSYRVTGDKEFIVLNVIEGEGKDSAEFL